MIAFIRFTLTLLFFLALGFFEGEAYSQSTDYCAKAKSIVEHISVNHFSAKPIDADYIKAFGQVLSGILDEEKLIFNSADVQDIHSAVENLASNLKNNDCAFLEEIARIFENKLNEKEAILQQLSSYSWKSTIENFNFLYEENHTYLPPNAFQEHLETELNTRLIFLYYNENPDSKSIDAGKLNVLGSSMIEQEICQLNRLKTNIPKYVGEAVLQAICITHDPHSAWFSDESSRKFLNMMSNNNLGYGFYLKMNAQGNLKIKEVVPGSSVWNSNQINEGDILLSIKVGNNKKRFDCNEIDAANELLSNDKITTANFEILKKSGKTLEIELSKSKLESPENLIQSFVLEGERKVGYICLPTFFSPDNFFELGCSDAVAKQLIKLKREGIEALIFDLRNNGGGDMDEALRVASMFINQGSIAITLLQNNDAALVKDPSRGMLFDAPLIVLQNQLSGSASELFAACIQDYNRGLIVGSPSFGKASMQTMMPLKNSQSDGMDFLKVTIGKFYRVDGTSHQGKGVLPDIVLENSMLYNKYKEEYFLTAFENDLIDKESYFKALAALPLDALRENSANRLAQHDYFKKVTTINNQLKSGAITADQILNFTNIKSTEAENIDEKNTNFNVVLPTFLSEYSNSMNAQKLLNQIKNDPYIEECFEIAKDLIQLD